MKLESTTGPVHSEGLSIRWQHAALVCIVLLGLAFRIKPTLSPDLDRTLWKEIDYIVISQNYAAHGMHFLQPEISWPAEPPRVTAMEFPAVPFGAALLYKIFGFGVLTVRLIPLLAFLILPFYLFFLVRDEMGPLPALLSSLIAALMPISHPFGRILFSEPVSITMSVAALFHFNRWAQRKSPFHCLCALLAFSLAVAVKFEPLFMLLPLSYIWWRYRGFNKSVVVFAAFVGAALVVPACWMLYAYHLSQTSIDVFGVVPFLHGHNKLQTFTMIRSLHFWLALGHRVWILDWGLLGVPFVAVGLWAACKDSHARLFLVYLAAIAAYFVIVAEGNIDAAYRQLNAVPVMSLLMALGVLTVARAMFSRLQSNVNLKKQFAVGVTVILFVSLPSYWRVFRESPLTPSHPHAWELAQQIKAHASPGERIVTLGEYTEHVGGNDLSPVLYYYSGLQGWSLDENQISDNRLHQLMQKRATLLAVDDEFALEHGFTKPETAALMQKWLTQYPVLYQSGNCYLLRLASPARQ
jgi:hypothetical protein